MAGNKGSLPKSLKVERSQTYRVVPSENQIVSWVGTSLNIEVLVDEFRFGSMSTVISPDNLAYKPGDPRAPEHVIVNQFGLRMSPQAALSLANAIHTTIAQMPKQALDALGITVELADSNGVPNV